MHQYPRLPPAPILNLPSLRVVVHRTWTQAWAARLETVAGVGAPARGDSPQAVLHPIGEILIHPAPQAVVSLLQGQEAVRASRWILASEGSNQAGKLRDVELVRSMVMDKHLVNLPSTLLEAPLRAGLSVSALPFACRMNDSGVLW